MPKPSTLSTRLAQARVVSGLLQREFAKLTGFPLNSLKHLENGSHKLSPSQAVLISSHLGVSAAWLLGFGKEKNPVNMRGEPFTREYSDFFRQHLKQKIEEFGTMYSTLHRARTKAWVEYISSLVKHVLDPSKSLFLIELLGCELSSILLRDFPEKHHGSTPKFSSVDDVVRLQLKKARKQRNSSVWPRRKRMNF